MKAFVAAIRPLVSVISCGFNNTHGAFVATGPWRTEGSALALCAAAGCAVRGVWVCGARACRTPSHHAGRILVLKTGSLSHCLASLGLVLCRPVAVSSQLRGHQATQRSRRWTRCWPRATSTCATCARPTATTRTASSATVTSSSQAPMVAALSPSERIRTSPSPSPRPRRYQHRRSPDPPPPATRSMQLQPPPSPVAWPRHRRRRPVGMFKEIARKSDVDNAAVQGAGHLGARRHGLATRAIATDPVAPHDSRMYLLTGS